MKEKYIYQINILAPIELDRTYDAVFFFTTLEEAKPFIEICMEQNQELLITPYFQKEEEK